MRIQSRPLFGGVGGGSVFLRGIWRRGVRSLLLLRLEIGCWLRSRARGCLCWSVSCASRVCLRRLARH